jgi:hypothetical protein
MIFHLLALAAAGAAGAGQPPSDPPLVTVIVPAAPAQPDVETLAAAREMLRGGGDFERQFLQTAQLSSQASLATMIEVVETRRNVDLPPELEAELSRIVADHVGTMTREILPAVLEDSARVYARYFSAEELRELNRLMRTPVLVRMQQVAPQLLTELQQVGVRAALGRQPELERRLTDAVGRWLSRRGEPPLS